MRYIYGNQKISISMTSAFQRILSLGLRHSYQPFLAATEVDDLVLRPEPLAFGWVQR